MADEDFLLALQLQEQFNNELSASVWSDDNSDSYPLSKKRKLETSDLRVWSYSRPVQPERPLSIVDESWEMLDPNPDVRAMFLQFNEMFFWGKLSGVEVKWSPRMTLCAGVCSYEGRGGLCSIRLSEPLLKLRPRKDLVETLLHEMIHALLFVTQNNRDRDGHGPEFCKHMNRINQASGTKISIYHSFHDEVDVYRQHWWRCNGPCQNRKPFFGYVKRAMNRAPSARDPWWEDHRRTCGGTYTKIKEPENYGKKGKSEEEKKEKNASKKPGGKMKPAGSTAGKGRELADVMERRKVDILCVQETRWKGSKARSIGAEFKLFYYGLDRKRNGVGVVLKEEFVRNVLEVKRVSDRVMSLKLEIEGVMLNVVSGYAPQVGCELEEKERFWSELDEVMESIPTGERVVIGADFNGHVGEGNTGDEEVMGKFGVKERNLEGQMVVDFAKRMDMAVVNTYFQKREEHRVTYKSGGRRTQKLRQALGGQVLLPDDWETTAEVIRETGRKVLGVSSGRRKEDKETWWWNEEVQDSIQRKRLAKKKWDMDRTEENRQEYKELQRRVKREVSKAKQKAYDELYTRLDTREGEKDLYRLARQRDRDGKDVQQVRVIKDRDGRVLTSEESVQRRWKEYFEEMMNEENEREKRVEGVNSVEQKVDKIRKDEVRKALKRMKNGKAVGPDDIPVEVWKCLGEAAVEFLTSLFNRVLENVEKAYDRVPREELWYCMRKSGVAEKYVRVVQDMYERSRTVVRCAVGQTEEFKVEVGLHQGSALSPFLFAIVMDQLSEEVRQESPWTMMFADDIVICSESREQVEENLERWRFALERRGMKVSRSKTEYMCVNEREGSGTVRLQGEEVKKVQEFKYLGSTVQSNGECGKEVKKRVQAGWNGWRKVTGVLCDRKISARIKGKVYRTVVRAAMLYGLETVSLRKRQESELEVAELKMLRFSLGVTRLDRIRNEYIRGTAHVGRLGDKVREARLRWFGHVQRRESSGSQDIRNVIPFSGRGIVLGGSTQPSASTQNPSIQSPTHSPKPQQEPGRTSPIDLRSPYSGAPALPKRSVSNHKAFVNINGSPVRITKTNGSLMRPKQTTVQDLFQNASLKSPKKMNPSELKRASDTPALDSALNLNSANASLANKTSSNTSGSAGSPFSKYFSSTKPENGVPAFTLSYFGSSKGSAAASSGSGSKSQIKADKTVPSSNFKSFGSPKCSGTGTSASPSIPSTSSRLSGSPEKSGSFVLGSNSRSPHKAAGGRKRWREDSAHIFDFFQRVSRSPSSSLVSREHTEERTGAEVPSTGASGVGSSLLRTTALTVTCPVCHSKVLEAQINQHLDSCLM
ncbi:hypothetical protein QTP86_027198 [Hemibagrus guttatus]|nr:hypothetical protein QTP86_027198 [Hemibagrus guttatus]